MSGVNAAGLYIVNNLIAKRKRVVMGISGRGEGKWERER